MGRTNFQRLMFIPWALGCTEGGGGGLLSQAAALSWAPAEQLQSCGLAPDEAGTGGFPGALSAEAEL